ERSRERSGRVEARGMVRLLMYRRPEPTERRRRLALQRRERLTAERPGLSLVGVRGGRDQDGGAATGHEGMATAGRRDIRGTVQEARPRQHAEAADTHDVTAREEPLVQVVGALNIRRRQVVT